MLKRSNASASPPQDRSLDNRVVQVEFSRDDDFVRNRPGSVGAYDPQPAKDVSVAVADCRVGTAIDLDALPLYVVFVVKKHASPIAAKANSANARQGPRVASSRLRETPEQVRFFGVIDWAMTSAVNAWFAIDATALPFLDHRAKRSAAWRAHRKTSRWMTALLRSSSVETLISCT